MAGRFKRTKDVGPQSSGPRAFGNRPANLSATTMSHSNRSHLFDKEQLQQENEDLDAKFGFERLRTNPPDNKPAYMFNMRQNTIKDVETGHDLSCLDMYFVQETGNTFKASHIFQPYFLINVQGNTTVFGEVEQYLMYKYPDEIVKCVEWMREDLELPNHLSGLQRKFMKLCFRNVEDLVNVRRSLLPQIEKNKQQQAKNQEAGLESFGNIGGSSTRIGMDEENMSGKNGQKKKRDECMNYVVDIREYDVLYVQRVSIDTGYRCGLWYDIIPEEGTGSCTLKNRPDLLEQPPLKKMAFDIETTKPPLKFPNADADNVMMISYMLDGEGFLICNRSIISEDINDFEYTPKPEYEGVFTVINVPDEKALLEKWIEHIEEVKPHLYVTYNGDFFDWPFIAKRCQILGINLYKRIGVFESQGEYMGRFSVHLDAFCWVKRDSYLPQGSQGLKAVTKHKLKYEPVELDPEDMLPFARDRPQELAAYSVSDAVATYYLYMKYVHLFVFSLATIIPMPPSDVLRKGSGTLCELLLMVQAFEKNIVSPNKERTNPLQFYKGHLLESETYIGGHVECLESGVFRADLPAKFKVVPKRIQMLLDNLDRTLRFAIEVEGLQKMENIDMESFEEVKAQITEKLVALRDNPNIEVKPLIYHLDVGAMYPNIILTNRLQPMAIVDAQVCASCDFNRPGMKCQRFLKWSWRGRYFPATQAEFQTIKAQLEVEPLKHDEASLSLRNKPQTFSDLPYDQQAARIMARVKQYSNKVYRGFAKEDVEERDACICQRENPFYVDTVRAFRDRRYEYKRLGKKAKQDVDAAVAAKNELDKVKANDRLLLYDSLQLAHKCILNSFYGYVMRRGARWHSIEMAGVVTQTGANIIKDARVLVEEIGRPLELDTDGIWCMIPSTFPESYKVSLKNGKGGVPISYPCSMLNVLVADNYTNSQYWGKKPDGTFGHISECSIFFEVDGPYRAMVLPAAREEGKNIKKRYAVFADDGSISELKGFEIKRRGELQLIKIFQEQVFKRFLDGKTLQQCYDSVGSAANHWLDICYNQGHDLEDEDVFALISENKSMSEALSEYGDRKSTSIMTARRLGEFLGEEMVKDKGLNCKFIITKKPLGAPTSERAVPVAIFSAEPAIMRSYLRKWLKDSSLDDFDVRSLLDWDYYIGRLNNAIQKIITIPAAFQKIRNPVPRVPHPDWLKKRVKERDDTHKQTRLASFFNNPTGKDIEDFGSQHGTSQFTNPLKPKFATVKKRIHSAAPAEEEKTNDAMDVEIDGEQEEKETGNSNSKKKRQMLSPSADGTVAAGTGLLGEDGGDSSSDGSPGRTRKIVQLDENGEEMPPDDDDEEESEEKQQLRKANDASSLLLDKAFDLAVLAPEQLRSPSKARARGAGGSSVPHTPGSASKARARLNFGSETALVPTGPVQTLVCEETPTDENFGEWMKSLKSTFRTISSKRKAARAKEDAAKMGVGNGSTNVKLGRDGLAGFLRKQQQVIRASYWQIVQLFEDDASPGLYRAWVVLDNGSLRQMMVNVPRVIYVNARHEIPDNGKKIQRILPRGRPCLNLYEVSMTESEYRANEKELHSSLQNRHEIEGVYETQVPLLFKAIMDVGCVCKVDSRPATTNQAFAPNEYTLEQLVYKTTAECPYLPAETVSLRKIYLYYSFADTRRGVFGLFIEGRKDIQLVAVNGWPGELEKVNLKRVLNDCVEMAKRASMDQVQDGSEFGNSQSALGGTIKVPSSNSIFAPMRMVKTHQAGFDAINEMLREYKAVSTSPTIVLAQTGGLTLPTLYSKIPILKNEYPVVMITANLNDNVYPSAPLPWYPRAAQQMVERYVAHTQWWIDQLHFCRYAHVPIGNMESDYPAYISDLFFARALKHSGHLLWMSKGPRPDLGGLEEDENYFADEHVNPESSKPGIYRKVCMEIEIGQLAVNAVVQQQLIEEMEGGGGLGLTASSNSNSANADAELADLRTLQEGSQSCRDAFRVLKNCVSNWLSDTLANHNEDADMLLRHFYRWLRSPSSKLYDGALHRFVHALMKKILAQLLARFRLLGSTVVYANQSRLIIDTMKPSIPHALAYTKFILETIKARPLFQMLTLDATRMWESLGFMDAANFGGILAAGQSEDDSKRTRRQLSDGREIMVELESNWNIADYLPVETQDMFLLTIAEFLIQPMEVRMEAIEALRQELEEKAAFVGGVISGSQKANLQLQLSSEKEEEGIAKQIEQRVETKFAQQLFGLVDRIKHISSLRGDDRLGDQQQAIQFPVLAGSHLPLHNPALEFVKAVCHVMGLDAELQGPVRRVRESLMKLVGVKSFSNTADFINPCLTFVLPDVICSYCNQCRDLDLCRDPDLIMHKWNCPICAQPYDKGVIEGMLVEFVQRRSVAYQVQDLQCATCSKIKVTNMAKYCPCSGHFVNTVSPQAFDKLMRTFANIACYHGFEWLRETVTFIREREPEITEFDDPAELLQQDAAEALEKEAGVGTTSDIPVEID